MNAVESTDDAVPVWQAARILDLSIAEVYDLVFALTLPTVEAPNGRRLVTRAAIEAWQAQKASLSA